MANNQQPLELKDNEDSDDDFETVPQDEHRSKRIKSSQDESELTLHNTCSICLEPWSSSGKHKIVSIKCGHLFGNSCIAKWIQTSKQDRKSKCPECNQPCVKQDIRSIWTKNIVATDTAELEKTRKEVMEYRQKWCEAEDERIRLRQAYQSLSSEMAKVENEVDRLRVDNAGLVSQFNSLYHNQQRSALNGCKYFYNYTSMISNEPLSARSLSFNSRQDMIVVSKSISSPAATGFTQHGLLKVNFPDLVDSDYISIHAETIRDVKCHPSSNGLVLTTGLDRTLKLTNIIESLSVVQSFQLDSPGWSCCWNTDDPNYMFCGLSNGFVMMFDVRNANGPVHRLNNVSLTGPTPVHSLVHIPQNDDGITGLLGANLGCAFLWENHIVDENVTELGQQPEAQCSVFDNKVLDASCYSISYDNQSRQLLTSFRSFSKNFTKHIVGSLKKLVTGRVIFSGADHYARWTGQTVLAKTLIFSRKIEEHPEVEPVYVCMGDEKNGSLVIWNSEDKEVTEYFPPSTKNKIINSRVCISEPVLDIKRCVAGYGLEYLVGLTSQNLHLYNWN